MITLRKIEPTDLPFLYQWENDASAWADGSNHNPLSQQDLRDYIANTTGDIYRDGQLRLMIVQDGVTVGCADLFDLDIRNRRAAIGLYLAPEYRGQGWGAQAMDQLEQYAFGFLHLRLIYAVVAETNLSCRKIYEDRRYLHLSPLRHWTLESNAVIYSKFYDHDD